MTGGAPPPTIKKDEADDILMSILNEKTLLELLNKFDDDNNVQPINITPSDDSVIECITNPVE